MENVMQKEFGGTSFFHYANDGGYSYYTRHEWMRKCLGCQNAHSETLSLKTSTSMRFTAFMKKYESHTFEPLNDYLLAVEYALTGMIKALEPYTLFLVKGKNKERRDFFACLRLLDSKKANDWTEQYLSLDA